MDLRWSILFVTSAMALIQEEFSYNCTTTLTCQEISGNVSVQAINTAVRGIRGERGPKGDTGDPCDCDKETTTLAPYLLLAMNETINGSIATQTGENISDSGSSCDCEPVMDEIRSLQTDVGELKSRNVTDYVIVNGQKGERGESCKCIKMESERKAINDQLGALRNRMRRFENQMKSLRDSSLPSRISSNPQEFLNDTLRYLPTRCSEIRGSEKLQNVSIYPLKSYLDVTPFYVNCADGGWIIIQRRTSATLGFKKNFLSYREGFGDKNGDFWIGLRVIRQLTAYTPYKLRLLMRSKAKPSESFYAQYGHFYIEDESQGYRLIVGDHTGNTTDYMRDFNSQKFSTYDLDRDTSSGNCANVNGGGWWYTNCGHGRPNDDFLKYFAWSQALIFSEMMIRPHP